MRVKWKALAISRYERMEEYRLDVQRAADTLEKVLDVITGDQAAELGVYDTLRAMGKGGDQ